VIVQLEHILEIYGCTREAYHGGDFNDVSIRGMVQRIAEMVPETRDIIILKKTHRALMRRG
jgi:hypothetical protein